MSLLKPKRVYLDYASTTPVLPEVKRVMDKYFTEDFYNPSSIYMEAMIVKRKVEEMRIRISRILGVKYNDIYFLASGTESANLAILGAFEAVRGKLDKPHIIISAIEHPAVKESTKEVVRRGGEVTVVGVDEFGRVSPQEILASIKPNTILVSIMLANNELGTIEPIGRISRLINEYKKKNNTPFPYIHTDASQAANYLKVYMPSLGVDLMTLDGSKIYGPKGVGVLVVRPNVELHPIIFGGGQEKGLRSGTENPSLIVGFTKAFEIADKDRESESKRLSIIKNKFIDGIKKSLPEAIINTPTEESLPNIVSVSVHGMLAEFVAIKLDRDGFMVSTGSACGTNKGASGTEALVALGRPELKESTIRFSFGRLTKTNDAVRALKAFIKIMQG